MSDPPPSLREAIQEVVVQHAAEWWHQLPDVWIVQGDTSEQWRDRLTPLKTAAGVAGVDLIVLRLPDTAEGRRWAGHGTPAGYEWFHGHYTPALPADFPAAAADDDIPF